MSNEDFEHKLKNKLSNAEIEPTINSWESIDKKLSNKDEKKVWGWFSKTNLILFFISLALVGYATYFLSNTKSESLIKVQNDIHIKKTESKKNDEPAVQSNFTNSVMTENTITEIPSKKYTYINNIKATNYKEILSNLLSNSKQQTLYIEPIVSINLISKSRISPFSYNHSIKNILLEDELIAEEVYNELNNIEPKRNENDTIYKFVIGASTYLISSYRNLKTSNNASALQKEQIDLRNKIENRNVDFNGGLFIKAQIKNNWYIGTGINIYNCSERVNFAYKSNVKDSVMPAIEMKEEFKNNNINNSNVFKLSGDSIYEYTQLTEQNNTLINHYYFNEIPLNISYIKFNKKWNWFIESGLSFNKLTVIHSSLVDIDKVGFTTVIDKVNYSGINQYMLNANLAAGLGYNISQTFSILLSTQIKYALTPLIDFGYAKQSPNAIGLGLVFAKRF